MAAQVPRNRHPPVSAPAVSDAHPAKAPPPPHPVAGSRGCTAGQVLQIVLFGVYFIGSCLSIAITQWIGAPLYFYSTSLFYTWMAMTKQHFGIVLATMTFQWAPVKMRVSGDASMRGQLRKTDDGRLECDFPERLVLISNHQIYTDWIYLWWIAYTSKMHGHLYIILKESIQYIPILGTGMMFFGFIFLSRKWSTDKERFRRHLERLSASHYSSLSNSKHLHPMWLMMFPEGTNLSENGRMASRKWADKNNMEDLRHALLPRSTGLSFCLQELATTVEWVYDCTLAYEGVPVGQYGQDLFSLKSTYFQGSRPKLVNMYWRRFRIADIPLGDEKIFSDWLLTRWREKDDLLQYYIENNQFPADEGMPAENGSSSGSHKGGVGWIETEIKPANWLEWTQIFLPSAALGLVINVVVKLLRLVSGVSGVKP